MSAERCVNIIDGLLNILDEADKREGGGDEQHTTHTHTHASGKTCSHDHGHGHSQEHDHKQHKQHGHEQHEHEHEHGHEQHAHGGGGGACPKSAAKAKTEEASKVFVYFQSLDEIDEGLVVQITPDAETLRTKWKQAGLVDNDEVVAFCSEIGKVTEIETSDDTLQIQWENYDTCWVPAFACGRAPSGAKPTIPGTNNSWLDESKAVGAEYAEELKRDAEEQAQEDGPLLVSAEDPALKEGQTLRVTRDLTVLEEKWQYCELGAHDNLSEYLGEVGTIQEIAEDDDTVNLRWDNNQTAWIPIQACMDGKGAKPTVPGLAGK